MTHLIAPAARASIRATRLVVAVSVLLAALLTVIVTAQVAVGVIAHAVTTDPCAPTAVTATPCSAR